MQRCASVSRFSVESADGIIIPPSPRPLNKFGKLFRLKTDPSTSSGKYRVTHAQSNNTQSPAFDAPLKKSASFRPRPRNTTNDNPRPLSDTLHHRNLSHSISTPAMHTSTLRPQRTSSMRIHRSSVFDGLSKADNEPHFFPMRRQSQRAADVPQTISEGKSKWTWKGRGRVPRKPRLSSPTTKENDMHEISANSYIPDVSTSHCPSNDIPEAQVLDIRPVPNPSSPIADEFRLTPISTRSSDDDDELAIHRAQRPRGSINKVARTLGFPEITFATEFGEVPLSASYDSYNPFDREDVYPVKKQSPVKLSRRLSLTLSTLTTIPTFFRSPSITRRTPPISPSQTSLTTLADDDVHQFGLTDDLSDTWGEISDSRTSTSDLPISPITFHVPPESRPSASIGKMKPSVQGEEVSPPFSTLTCGRSQSLSSLQVRQVARTASRPDTPFDEKANTPTHVIWSGSSVPAEPQPEDLISLRGTSKTWNGTWNQDDMQDVIKKLRCLK